MFVGVGQISGDFHGSGYQTIVPDWEFWSADAALTPRLPMSR